MQDDKKTPVFSQNKKQQKALKLYNMLQALEQHVSDTTRQLSHKHAGAIVSYCESKSKIQLFKLENVAQSAQTYSCKTLVAQAAQAFRQFDATLSFKPKLIVERKPRSGVQTH